MSDYTIRTGREKWNPRIDYYCVFEGERKVSPWYRTRKEAEEEVEAFERIREAERQEREILNCFWSREGSGIAFEEDEEEEEDVERIREAD